MDRYELRIVDDLYTGTFPYAVVDTDTEEEHDRYTHRAVADQVCDRLNIAHQLAGEAEHAAAIAEWVRRHDTAPVQDTQGECIYCGAWVQDVTEVPAINDRDRWEDLAAEHESGCEWITTLAHRVDPTAPTADGDAPY